MVVSLATLALLAAASAPAATGAPAGSELLAQTAKKKCKKGKKSAATAKKKCKKKPAVPAPVPTASGASTPPPPPPPPPDTRTTEQKIDDAVSSGEITAEQGLTYKVFAGFNDPRLPSKYAGEPDPVTEPPLDDVTAKWDQLSPGAKATLGPFLIPPMHEGSYWEQLISGATPSATPSATLASSRVAAEDPDSPWCATAGEVAFEDWHFVEATSGTGAGKVRIWYQDRYAATDATLAGNLMSSMEGKIWPRLTALMGRDPLPDFGSTGFCAGGSDAVDIALVDATKGTTTPTIQQENSPAHMVFPRAGSGGTPPYLAHEFMHMIQYSFTLGSGDLSDGENQWLKEGTAQWVQDYVTSSQYAVGLAPDQTEHQALAAFLPVPEQSLDSTSSYRHDYGSYLFWLWAARKGNDPTIVRQVWNAVASQKSLAAAKSVFGSGWAQAWKDFTKANWNKDPIGDYQDWDDIHDSAKIAAEGNLPHDQITPVNTLVDPVAAKYLRFVPRPEVGTLIYRNNGTVSDDAGIQAIIKYKDGSTGEEDWSQITQQDVPFCAIDELVLVLSNASITPSDSKLFALTFSPPASVPHSSVGPRAANVCLPDPQGSFSGSATYTDASTTLSFSWNGSVDFDPFGPTNPPFPEYATEVWDAASVASGSVTISGDGTIEGSDGTCTIDIPADTYDFDPGGGTMAIQPGPEPHYGIDLPFPPNQFLQATITCPDEDPSTGPWPAPREMVYTPTAQQTLTRGSYQGSTTYSGASYTWSFSDPLAPPP